MRSLSTKIIIRRLPPKLTEEKFLEIVKPLPAHDYLRFCIPDGSVECQGFSRAYINFCDPQSVFEFRERFSDYTFIDDEGNESNAIVEFAVFQEVPYDDDTTKCPKRADKRQGTIFEDLDYIEFMASLSQSLAASEGATVVEKKQTPWEAMLEIIKQRDETTESQTTTPLIAFLNSRIDRRRRQNPEEKGAGKVSGYRVKLQTNAQAAARRAPEYSRYRSDAIATETGAPNDSSRPQEGSASSARFSDRRSRIGQKPFESSKQTLAAKGISRSSKRSLKMHLLENKSHPRGGESNMASKLRSDTCEQSGDQEREPLEVSQRHSQREAQSTGDVSDVRASTSYGRPANQTTEESHLVEAWHPRQKTGSAPQHGHGTGNSFQSQDNHTAYDRGEEGYLKYHTSEHRGRSGRFSFHRRRGTRTQLNAEQGFSDFSSFAGKSGKKYTSELPSQETPVHCQEDIVPEPGRMAPSTRGSRFRGSWALNCGSRGGRGNRSYRS